MARYHLYHWCHVPVPPFIPFVRRPLYSLSCPAFFRSRSVSLVTLFSLSISYHDCKSWHPPYQRQEPENVQTSTVANLPLDRHIKLITSVSHQHSIEELGYDTAKKWVSESHIPNCQKDPDVSISALLGPGPRAQAVSRLVTSRLVWKTLTALLARYLETILLSLVTPRGLRGATSGSLGSSLHCALLFSALCVLQLCTLCSCGHQTHAHCFTNRAILYKGQPQLGQTRAILLLTRTNTTDTSRSHDPAPTRSRTSAMPSSDTSPPGWCAAATTVRTSQATPSRPSSSVQPSYSARSSAVSCSSPPCALVCAAAFSDRTAAPRPLGASPVPAVAACRAFSTSRWATSRCPWLMGPRPHRLTHVHLPTRARGVLPGGATVHLSFCFGLRVSAHLYQLSWIECKR